MNDVLTQFSESLHLIGMQCCDKGVPVKKDDFSECHCVHTIDIKKVEDKIPNDNEHLDAPECRS